MQPSVEHVPIRSDAGFLWKHAKVPRGWDFAWHAHPELELTLILQGEGRRYVGDHVETFAAGDLVLVGSGLPHTWHSSRPTRGEAIVLQLAPNWIESVLVLGGQMRSLGRLVEQSSTGLRFTPATVRRVKAPLTQLAKLRGPRQVATVLSVLAELAGARGASTLSSDAFAAKSTRRQSWNHPTVDAAVRFVEDHIAQTGFPPTQADTAAAVHTSPSAFSRLFKHSTGRSFTQYLHELRIGTACRLLLENDEAVTAVAHASGFANLANFNRVFKSLRGVSPRAFRQQFQSA